MVANRTCTQWLSAWNMSGLACSCRVRACPPISHPRRWLCSLPWHACVHVRWVIGQEFTVRACHPYLLRALLILELRGAVLLSLQSFSLFFGNKLLSAKKRKEHCEMATDCSFAKNIPPKMWLFFAFARLPNHWLFGIPLPKILCHQFIFSAFH